MNQNQIGMTLIELLIVIMMISILSGIAIPSFYQMLNHYRFTKAVSDLEGFIQHAKLKSMKDKMPYSVCFDKKKNSYFEKKYGLAGISSAPEISLSSYQAGIHIETAKNIHFTRNGLIRGTGKIKLKASSGVSKIICFYMAGGVSVETYYH